jgi:hypothetical protein
MVRRCCIFEYSKRSLGMCKKMLFPTTILAIIFSYPQALFADNRWDYVELSYTFDGELDTDVSKLDYKGSTLDVSSSFNSDAFFLRGQATSFSSSDETLLLPDTDITIADWTSIGPGIHHTSQIGGMDLDIWGQFTLNRAAFIAVATKGVGAALGARLNVTPDFETSLSYRHATTDRSYSGVRTVFNPSVWTLEALYHLNPSSALRLAYSDGSADIEGGPLTFASESIDINEVQLGYRYVFGAQGKSAREEPKPLSFNFVQLDYVFSGDTSIETGNQKQDFDLSRGFAVKGAFEFCHMFYFGGEVLTFDYDGSVGGPDEDIYTVNDMSFFGPGAYVGITENIQAYAQIGLQTVHYIYVPLEGFGAKVGARAKIGPTELNAWYQYGDTDGDVNNQTLMLEPTLYGVELALEFAPKMPELVIGYMDGKLEGDVEDTTTTLDIDPSHASLGVRFRY